MSLSLSWGGGGSGGKISSGSLTRGFCAICWFTTTWYAKKDSSLSFIASIHTWVLASTYCSIICKQSWNRKLRSSNCSSTCINLAAKNSSSSLFSSSSSFSCSSSCASSSTWLVDSSYLDHLAFLEADKVTKRLFSTLGCKNTSSFGEEELNDTLAFWHNAVVISKNPPILSKYSLR